MAPSDAKRGTDAVSPHGYTVVRPTFHPFSPADIAARCTQLRAASVALDPLERLAAAAWGWQLDAAVGGDEASATKTHLVCGTARIFADELASMTSSSNYLEQQEDQKKPAVGCGGGGSSSSSCASASEALRVALLSSSSPVPDGNAAESGKDRIARAASQANSLVLGALATRHEPFSAFAPVLTTSAAEGNDDELGAGSASPRRLPSTAASMAAVSCLSSALQLHVDTWASINRPGDVVKRAMRMRRVASSQVSPKTDNDEENSTATTSPAVHQAALPALRALQSMAKLDERTTSTLLSADLAPLFAAIRDDAVHSSTTTGEPLSALATSVAAACAGFDVVEGDQIVCLGCCCGALSATCSGALTESASSCAAWCPGRANEKRLLSGLLTHVMTVFRAAATTGAKHVIGPAVARSLSLVDVLQRDVPTCPTAIADRARERVASATSMLSNASLPKDVAEAAAAAATGHQADVRQMVRAGHLSALLVANSDGDGDGGGGDDTAANNAGTGRTDKDSSNELHPHVATYLELRGRLFQAAADEPAGTTPPPPPPDADDVTDTATTLFDHQDLYDTAASETVSAGLASAESDVFARLRRAAETESVDTAALERWAVGFIPVGGALLVDQTASATSPNTAAAGAAPVQDPLVQWRRAITQATRPPAARLQQPPAQRTAAADPSHQQQPQRPQQHNQQQRKRTGAGMSATGGHVQQQQRQQPPAEPSRNVTVTVGSKGVAAVPAKAPHKAAPRQKPATHAAPVLAHPVSVTVAAKKKAAPAPVHSAPPAQPAKPTGGLTDNAALAARAARFGGGGGGQAPAAGGLLATPAAASAGGGKQPPKSMGSAGQGGQQRQQQQQQQQQQGKASAPAQQGGGKSKQQQATASTQGHSTAGKKGKQTAAAAGGAGQAAPTQQPGAKSPVPAKSKKTAPPSPRPAPTQPAAQTGGGKRGRRGGGRGGGGGHN